MTERGMIMSAHNVRAIERRLKTQTRRVLDPQPEIIRDRGVEFLQLFSKDRSPVLKLPLPLDEEAQQAGVKALCHYQPGMRAYLKQRWRVFRALNSDEFEQKKKYQLMIDYGDLLSTNEWKDCDHDSFMKYAHDDEWKNSRFMPKWASRSSIDIIDVRLEQLGEMSVHDCHAEGVTLTYEEQVQATGSALLVGRESPIWDNAPTKENFRWFWNLINGGTNPYNDHLWVWAITFNLVPKENP